MQWNMLATSLGRMDELTAIAEANDKQRILDWGHYRLWRTLQELIMYDCDVIVMEEADSYEEIKPYLHLIGYTSIFCPKFDSPCLCMTNSVGPDGQAIFYKKSLFQVANMSCEKIIVNGEIHSQTFTILTLKHMPSARFLTVVAIHLKSKTENHTRRSEQVTYILDVLKTHMRQSSARFNGLELKNHPLIMCGDFNGEPFEDFYRLIVEDKDFDGLVDAYSPEDKTSKKQPTTVKFRNGSLLQRGIDYIFYKPANLALVRYLRLPSMADEASLHQEGLPNLHYSSDHMSLVCDFKFV